RAVFPTPASPETTTDPLRPLRARSISAASSPISRSRPQSRWVPAVATPSTLRFAGRLVHHETPPQKQLRALIPVERHRVRTGFARPALPPTDADPVLRTDHRIRPPTRAWCRTRGSPLVRPVRRFGRLRAPLDLGPRPAPSPLLPYGQTPG